jgi:hypothetical protein
MALLLMIQRSFRGDTDKNRKYEMVLGGVTQMLSSKECEVAVSWRKMSSEVARYLEICPH